jgi:hypothetical protein
MNRTNATRFLQATLLAALSAAALLAPAHAATGFDLSDATLATGPAGTIGNNFVVLAADGSPLNVTNGSGLPSEYHRNPAGYYFFTQINSTLIWGGSTSGAARSTQIVDGASLLDTFSGVSFGLEPHTFVDGAQTYYDPYEQSIVGSGYLYQDFVSPELTSLQFTATGTSPAAATGVAVAKLTAYAPDGQTFTQAATWDQAGNWTLTVNTPIGFNVFQFGLVISGIGHNTLTSVRITPMLAAVPEASTLAMMGLGLIGLGWARRQGRTH